LQHGEVLLLTLTHDIAGFDGFGLRCRRIFRNREHGRSNARDFIWLIEVEKPVIQSDIPPHIALLRLLIEATHDCRDSVGDGHDGTVHFIAEKSRAADIGAERFVGEPVAVAPHHLLSSHHPAADRRPFPSRAGFASGSSQVTSTLRSVSRVTAMIAARRLRVIVLFHLLISRVLRFVKLRSLWIVQIGVQRQRGYAAEELALFELMLAQKEPSPLRRCAVSRCRRPYQAQTP
jgi:hypothetical protein